MSTDGQRSVLWRRRDLGWLEHCDLQRDERGWCLRGTVVGLFDSTPGCARYRLRCDSTWRSLHVVVDLEHRGLRQRLRLRHDRDERWRINEGAPLKALEGCTDIDLGLSPSTNTLPIRRLVIGVGAQVSVAAAWVRFPELVVQRSEQRYTRTGATTYRYESGSFSADVDVDEIGLVRRYGDLWERLEEPSSSAR